MTETAIGRAAAARRRCRPRVARASFAAVTLAVLASGAPPAAAQTSALTAINYGPERGLHRIDLVTGELTPVGPLGLPAGRMDALAFLPSGELMAVDIAGDLLRIDPVTGQGTVIGSLGLEPLFGFYLDLAADACGWLWMTALPGPKYESYALYRIDPATGAAELRGTLPMPVEQLAARGNQLYGLVNNPGENPRIVEVDPELLTLTEIAELDGLSDASTYALDFDSGGDLLGLAFGFVPIPVPPPTFVFRTDLAGNLEPFVPLGSFSYPLQGLAVARPAGACSGGAPFAIPALSPVGLLVLVGGLAAAGGLLLAQQRREHRRPAPADGRRRTSS